MRFDSYSHVLNFKMTGTTFPAIHDDIFTLIKRNILPDGHGVPSNPIPEKSGKRTFLDLGCCHGLLSARIALQVPYSHVIGIDADNRYIASAIAERPAPGGVGINTIPNIEYQQFKIDGSVQSLENFAFLLREKRVEYVVARRVFPELWQTAFEWLRPTCKTKEDAMEEAMKYVRSLAQMLREYKIGVFLEGRVPSPKATNALKSVYEELRMFQEATDNGWKVTDTLNACRFLTPSHCL